MGWFSKFAPAEQQADAKMLDWVLDKMRQRKKQEAERRAQEQKDAEEAVRKALADKDKEDK